MTKLHVGDPVIICSGKYKNQTGTILSIHKKKKRQSNVVNTYVAVSGINVNRAKKGQGFIQKPSLIHISNVAYAYEGNPTKIFIAREGGKKLRLTKKTLQKI
ncbi:MAG: KOW motif-containing protein [Candidatus Absconditabacterales bacterium]|nr:KOW motif-containing protein [Candidatus Absconditabacterales bacterium]